MVFGESFSGLLGVYLGESLLPYTLSSSNGLDGLDGLLV
jgi:hypothetical protein